jgi:hypothetical protein
MAAHFWSRIQGLAVSSAPFLLQPRIALFPTICSPSWLPYIKLRGSKCVSLLHVSVLFRDNEMSTHDPESQISQDKETTRV